MNPPELQLLTIASWVAFLAVFAWEMLPGCAVGRRRVQHTPAHLPRHRQAGPPPPRGRMRHLAFDAGARRAAPEPRRAA